MDTVNKPRSLVNLKHIRAAVLNPLIPGATFTLSYLLAGHWVINENNLL
jgi:hypothetical protein